jgi:hypothetical protein
VIRLSFVILALATPVAAQDMSILQAQLGDLDRQKDSQAMAPLLAACLLGNGDAQAMAAPFDAAGWTRFDDPEMGMISQIPPWGDPYVTILDNGAICDVTSETMGLMKADQNLIPLLAAAGFTVVRTDVPSGCVAYYLGGGITAEMTSSGNDPACQSDDTSNIRLTFSAP